MRWVLVVLAAWCGVMPVTGAAADPTLPRIRGVDPEIGDAIAGATAGSPTFRKLVEAINGTDGIVYVARGVCGHGVVACLLSEVTMAGPNRVLRILIGRGLEGVRLMSAIGHELQHARELLSDSRVNSSARAMLFFHDNADSYHRTSLRYETDAAQDVGGRVASELRRARRAGVQPSWSTNERRWKKAIGMSTPTVLTTEAD